MYNMIMVNKDKTDSSFNRILKKYKCPRCKGTLRFIGERGPYCRSCGWCSNQPPRPNK